MSTNSSERTITTAPAGAPPSVNTLTAAHHFVSTRLTMRNYLFWRTQVVPFLRGQGLLGFVDGSKPCPAATIAVTPESGSSTVTAATTAPNPAYEAWIQQDQAILSTIISSLSDKVMHLAVGRETSREVWDSLASTLASTTRARCLSLLGQFQTLRQGPGSPADYLGRCKMIAEALSLAGRPLSDEEQILYVLRGLRPEFRTMVNSLTATGASVTLTQLSDFLQAQEFIHEDDFAVGESAGGGGSPAAFYAGRGRHGDQQHGNRGGRGRQNRGGRNGQNGGRQGRGGGPRFQICRSHGHTALYCYKRYADRPAGHANVAVSGESAVHGADAWYPDTGASSHATPDEQMLNHSETYTGGDVLKIGNGTGLDVSRIGHTVIHSNSNSKSLSMSNILCVPNLTLPLLSVYRFTNENDVYFEFHKNLFYVKDCKTQVVLLKGSTSGGVYKLLVPNHHLVLSCLRVRPPKSGTNALVIPTIKPCKES
ncbi:PREDICTED: uncharacterized protein LOC109186244 [Ipomoea nil]|uniref:uncharacterized protein LOC109186244 n=1 Tax=Ipomoea nil TaxID=35883 RepID=UPI00090097BD|nr:PREDICTED: uncharacterized protein LOC109186244 [Ipomoea nil]